jgi:hypothetical protein
MPGVSVPAMAKIEATPKAPENWSSIEWLRPKQALVSPAG